MGKRPDISETPLRPSEAEPHPTKHITDISDYLRRSFRCYPGPTSDLPRAQFDRHMMAGTLQYVLCAYIHPVFQEAKGPLSNFLLPGSTRARILPASPLHRLQYK